MLRARLETRLGEIEEATLARVNAISDPAEVADPAYADGLRRAIATALGYALDAIERGPGQEAPVPVSLLAQARLAARVGVSLDAVLRRYFAGFALLGGVLIEEAEELELAPARLSDLLAASAPPFDRLLAAVGEEHARELERRPASSRRRRLDLVRSLLGGERVDPGELSYDLGAHHLGLVAEGPGADELLRSLAGALDRRLLAVRPDEQKVWAWLGGRRPLDPVDVRRAVVSVDGGVPPNLALGEPAGGLAGWRLTHRQAAAALLVARRAQHSVVRYADAALLAAAMQDDLLATSLRRLYLAPLERQRDGGKMAKETLRAYFAADRNVSSAAQASGVSRPTLRSRLRAAEARLGRSLDECAPELDLVLRLEELAEDAASEPG